MAAVRAKLEERMAYGQAFREGAGTGSRRNITIIRSGWGSSGYYAPAVLERDIPRIFPTGTQMYLNHPTVEEEKQRPERDIRDLVGKVIETPRMAGIDSVSVAHVYEHWLPTINALAGDIGLSIRAFGTTEKGAAGGKEGPIVQSLNEGLSIDYVTKAGAGGEVGEMIESARSHSPSYQDQAVTAFNAILESAGQKPIPADLLKEVMSNPVLGEEDLIFEAMRIGDMEIWKTGELVEAERYYDLFLERDVSDDERISLAKKGQAIPIKDDKGNIIGGRFPMANCEDVKAAAMSVGRGKGNDVKGFIKKVASKLSCPVPFKESGHGRTQPKENQVEIDEATLNATVAKAVAEAMNKQKSEQEEEDSKKKVKEAEDRAAKAEESLRKEKAARLVGQIVRESKKIPADVQARVIESSLAGNLPTLSDGSLDEGALTERANSAIRREAEYVAKMLGKKPGGNVEGVGPSLDIFENFGGHHEGSDDEDEPMSEADRKSIQKSYETIGMSESAAKAAAEGR